MPSTASKRPLWPGAGIFFLYLVLSVLLFSATWTSPAHRVPFGDVDVREVTWFMGWTPYALSHGQTPLFTTRIDFPDGVNLMWNTALSVPAVLVWPVTALFGPIVSTNAALTLALAASAWTAYLAARRLVQNRLAAIAAGLLYGFSPLMISQSAGHLHVTVAVFPPLALILLDELLVRQRSPAWLIGAGLGIAAAAQLLTGEEVLALTALLAVVALLVLAQAHRQQVLARLPHFARGLGVALGVFVVLAAYPLWMQFFGPARVHGILPDPYWTDLYAFVIPNQWQALRFAPGLGQQLISRNVVELGGAYLGVPLLLICGFVTIRLWSRTMVRIASVVAVVAAVLALGDQLHRAGHGTRYPLPWRLLEHLPLLQNIAPPRFMLFTYLMVALLLAIFIDWAVSQPRRTLQVSGIGLTLLALAAIFPAVPYPTDTVTVPPFFQAGGDVQRIPSGGVALVAPFSRHFTADAMMWQAVASMRFAMPEGYAYRPGPTRDPPPSSLQTRLNAIYYGLDRAPLTADQLQVMRSELGRMGVRTVIVGPEPRRDEVVDLFRGILGRDPSQTGGVDVWWDI